MRSAAALPRDKLVGMGVSFGKFTKTKQFRLHVTCLDYIAQHAPYKVGRNLWMAMYQMRVQSASCLAVSRYNGPLCTTGFARRPGTLSVSPCFVTQTPVALAC